MNAQPKVFKLIHAISVFDQFFVRILKFTWIFFNSRPSQGRSSELPYVFLGKRHKTIQRNLIKHGYSFHLSYTFGMPNIN